MEGNRRNFFKTRSSPQFKKKGVGKKGTWHNAIQEELSENDQSSDTVYRILCQSRKIGSVIGKGGNIIKALREETQAKITVADSVPGSDERVIIIFSPSTKMARRQSNDNSSEKDDITELHCAAQDALLKVHDRIIEEDLSGAANENRNEIVVTARLLVPNNMVGCLLGRKGDVIQRLRSETGANIRVLPTENLPACATSTDELVQISGKSEVAKRALYEVSTLLHQNPRKDRPPSSFTLPHGPKAFHPPGPPQPNFPPQGNSPWSHRNINSHDMPPWMGGFDNEPSGYGPADFDGGPPSHDEPPSEFTMKILCSAGKIGGVIGKGGSNVRQLQQETGASIHVEDVSAESDERVIRVSAFEALWNPRSQTIDAILHLQSRTSEYSEQGTITTRLLVPSSKVGCILGQGGQVINEMRRRTQADIRVFSKEDKPKCASSDEELVQISGSLGVAKDALSEISSRLRTRCLRDANAKAEPATIRSGSGFGPAGNLRVGGPPPSGGTWASSSGRYELLKGGIREYDSPSYHSFPSATGNRSTSNSVELKMPKIAHGFSVGRGGNNISEVGGTRVQFHDSVSGGPEITEVRRPSDHLNAAHSTFRGFVSSAGQNRDPQQGAYRSYGMQQSIYSSTNHSHIPYQNISSQHVPYQNMDTPHASYQNLSAPDSYHY